MHGLPLQFIFHWTGTSISLTAQTTNFNAPPSVVLPYCEAISCISSTTRCSTGPHSHVSTCLDLADSHAIPRPMSTVKTRHPCDAFPWFQPAHDSMAHGECSATKSCWDRSAVDALMVRVVAVICTGMTSFMECITLKFKWIKRLKLTNHNNCGLLTCD